LDLLGQDGSFWDWVRQYFGPLSQIRIWIGFIGEFRCSWFSKSNFKRIFRALFHVVEMESRLWHGVAGRGTVTVNPISRAGGETRLRCISRHGRRANWAMHVQNSGKFPSISAISLYGGRVANVFWEMEEEKEEEDSCCCCGALLAFMT